mgnify:CR=1 FL=1
MDNINASELRIFLTAIGYLIAIAIIGYGSLYAGFVACNLLGLN